MKVGDRVRHPSGVDGRVVWVSDDGKSYAVKPVRPIRGKYAVCLMGEDG